MKDFKNLSNEEKRTAIVEAVEEAAQIINEKVMPVMMQLELKQSNGLFELFPGDTNVEGHSFSPFVYLYFDGNNNTFKVNQALLNSLFNRAKL